MKRRTKSLVFFLLAGIFLIATPLAVFYSLGWRLDFKTFEITQPGVFYFKINPKSSEIIIDGKTKKKTDFLFGTSLISNLSAKNYNIEIKKDGYQSWNKNLEIENGKVTEAKNIYLFPAENIFTLASQNIENFFFSRDNHKLLILENDSQNNSWVLSNFNLEKKEKTQLIKEIDLSSATIKTFNQRKNSPLLPKNTSPQKQKSEFLGLEISPENRRVLIKTKSGSNISFYLAQIEKNPPTITRFDFPATITEAYFNPKNPQRLIAFGQGNLYDIGIEENLFSEPVEKDIVAFKNSDKDIYFYSKNGYLSKIDYFFCEKERLNAKPLLPKKDAVYQVNGSDKYVFLKENNILYQLSEDKILENISSDVKDFVFSTEGRKIAYYNDNEIWVLFLDQFIEQPSRKKGEKMFLIRFSEKLSNVFWFNGNYIIFTLQNKIKAVEIDNRDKINVADLGSIENERLFWSDYYNQIFIFNNKNLYSSQKIIN